MGIYNSERAEQEAIKIGLKFADSKDVIGDMSRAYHTDFSSVKIHTDSSADSKVKAAGKDAIAQGNDLFFGKGIFESHTPESNALVAHELTHTMQQGVVDGAVSESAPVGAAQGGKILDWFKNLFKSKDEKISFAKHENQKSGAGLGKWWAKQNSFEHDELDKDESRQGLHDYMKNRVGNDKDKQDILANGKLSNASNSTVITGLSYSRLLTALQGELGEGMSKDDIGNIYDNLLAPGRVGNLNRDKNSVGGITEEDKKYLAEVGEKGTAQLDSQFDTGVMQLKGVYLAQLRRLKNRYGTYMTQMHPEDFVSKVGPEVFDQTRLLQDCEQLMTSGGKYFDFENNADDREFQTLANYYNDAFQAVHGYMSTDPIGDDFAPMQEMIDCMENETPYLRRAYENEANVRTLGAVGFNDRDQAAYEKRVNKRFGKGKLKGIWGRFRNRRRNNNMGAARYT